MLEGEEGVAVQKCMEFLVKYGDAMKAKRPIKVDSASVFGLDRYPLGMGILGPDFEGVKVRALTAAMHNPTPRNAKGLGSNSN